MKTLSTIILLILSFSLINCASDSSQLIQDPELNRIMGFEKNAKVTFVRIVQKIHVGKQTFSIYEDGKIAKNDDKGIPVMTDIKIPLRNGIAYEPFLQTAHNGKVEGHSTYIYNTDNETVGFITFHENGFIHCKPR